MTFVENAPLGWPARLSQTLVRHRAGDELSAGANQMFRRMTDRAIHKNVGKTPLDVGADRIARTAHAALRFLADLRRALSRPVPLAWSALTLGGIAAIEVYPAATLSAHGIRSAGYKKPEHVKERREILDALRTRVALPDDVGLLEDDADALDAVVCLLAAKDFVEGQSIPPHDVRLAEQEGWIWSRGRSREGLTRSTSGECVNARRAIARTLSRVDGRSKLGGSYLEVTFRQGRPLAAYLYLLREARDKSYRTVRMDPGLVIDFNRGGKPIGIEITAPEKLSTAALNRVLRRFRLPTVTRADLAPLRAA